MKNKFFIIIGFILIGINLASLYCHTVIHEPENKFEKIKRKFYIEENEIRLNFELSKDAYLLQVKHKVDREKHREVVFNGLKFTANTFPYKRKKGDAETIYIHLPKEIIKPGENTINITLSKNLPLTLYIILCNYRKDLNNGIYIVFSDSAQLPAGKILTQIISFINIIVLLSGILVYFLYRRVFLNNDRFFLYYQKYLLLLLFVLLSLFLIERISSNLGYKILVTPNLFWGFTFTILTPLFVIQTYKILKFKYRNPLLNKLCIILPHYFNKYDFIPFATISIITLIAYYHGLFQVARADQLAYLGSKATETNLWSLTTRSYALNRLYCGVPDAILFRPIAYFILGLEKYFFGYNFLWWQLTNFLLHITVVFVLFKILRGECKNKSIMPFLFTLYFSVQYSSMEMVVWHHIPGYLFFTILMLIVIYIIQNYSMYSVNKRVLWFLVFCLFIASFTYELATPLAILTGLYLLFYDVITKSKLFIIRPDEVIGTRYKKFDPKIIVLIFAVPIIWFLTSTADLYFRFGNLSSYSQTVSKSFMENLSSIMYAIFFWIKTGFAPWLLKMTISGRIEIAYVKNSVSLIFSLLFFSLLIALVCVTINKEYIRKKLLFILLLIGLIFSHTTIIILGRANERGLIRALYNASYYSYMFNVLFVILLYNLINIHILNQKLKNKHSWFYPFLVNAFYLGFIAMIIANFSNVYNTNLEMRKWSYPQIKLVNEIEDLIKSHSTEPDFSFSVDKSCRNDEIPWFDYKLLQEEPLESTAPGKYTFAQILFPQYYRSVDGKYLIKLKE